MAFGNRGGGPGYVRAAILICGLVLGIGFHASAGDTGMARKITLVENGKPVAVIVLSAEPTRATQMAAFELQHHVRLITGAELPIVSDKDAVQGVRILVGESAATKALGLDASALGPQHYVVLFQPNALVLMGRDKDDREKVVYDLQNPTRSAGWPGFWEEQGTLHAVYDFLERFCDVRWMNPTEFGTFCPRRATLSVSGRNVARAPHFPYRDALGATGDNPSRYDAYVSLWAAGSPEFKAWDQMAYPSLHARFKNPQQYAAAHAVMARLFLLRMRNGGEPCRCNHSLYGYYSRFWEKNSNPKLAKLFVAKMPEMFAKGYQGTPPQMCYTSRELIEQLAQDARDYHDGKATGGELGIFWNPQLPNPFPVEPMDNSFFCKCAACQAFLKDKHTGGRSVYSTGTHSEYFFSFVNAVARELNKTHPGKKIVTLAYMTHAQMPKGFKLEPNVAVEFCFASNRSPFGPNYANELELLKQWGTESAGRPLYLWLYYTFPVERARNGKYHCFPGFFAHAIGQQFELFRKYGILGMFHCGYGQEVEAYVTFKLMDDPTLKVDDLLDDYFGRMYGAAAAPMKQIYLEIEKTYCNPKLHPRKRVSGPELSWGYLGTGERMAKLAALLAQAKQLAATDADRMRVALFEHSVWSYMVAGREQYVARKAAPIPSVKAPRVPAAAGDVTKITWDKAAPLTDKWYERGRDLPAARKFSGRVAHDGKFLYLELTDPCDTKKLVASASVFPYDDWEVFVAKQRDVPYRQYAVGPTGMIVALSHGEINWRMNVKIEEHGVRAKSDTSAPDKWVVRMAIPLRQAVPGGVAPGEVVYLNVLRVSSPAVSGAYPLGLDSWVSYCTVHEVDRLGEIMLAK